MKLNATDFPEALFDATGYNKLLEVAAAKSLQSCPTLCDPRDGSPPGSPVPAILQARTLEWVAMHSPMHESEKCEVAQSYPTLSDPMDGASLPWFLS